jgi:hypothetical protein
MATPHATLRSAAAHSAAAAGSIHTVRWLALCATAALMLIGFKLHGPCRGTLSSHGEPAPESTRPESDQSADPRPAGLVPASDADPIEAALLSIEASDDTADHSELIAEITSQIRHSEIPRWLAQLARPGLSESATELRDQIIRRWFRGEPAAAVQWTQRMAEQGLRGELLHEVALAWADMDRQQAAVWARSLPDDSARTEIMTRLGFEAARSEPKQAINIAHDLPASSARDELLIHALRQWAATDPTAALDYSRKIPEQDLREQALAGVAIAAAEDSGAAAATVVANELRTGEVQDRTAIAVVQRWAQRAPESVATWVASFDEGPTQDSAAQQLVTIWAQQSQSAPAEWLRALPSGRLRDAGMAAFAETVLASNHTMALTWAEAIADPTRRTATLQSLTAQTF